MKNQNVLFGVDCFLPQVNTFTNIRLGLVTNNVALTSQKEPSRKALLKAGFNIVKLFSPEHGLTAEGEDGAFQKNIIDPLTELPVISLYGDNLMPTENDLHDIDAVLFDIPDVGCRFYTYLWTMTYVIEACAAFKKKLIILDRPNPVGGNIESAEGPILDEKNCSSFIGRWNIPVRHSCTLGELANYFSATKVHDLDLQVIKIENWKREETVTTSGWFFNPTSPAILNEEIALLYPGMGMLEGINVNEGRGTATPFKIFGAPWINASQLQNELGSLNLPGIKSQTISYKPESGLYANENCNGLIFTITDTQAFRPVQTALQLIRLILLLYPEQCKERFYITRANPSGSQHLDKLTGVFISLQKLKNKEPISSVLKDEEWKKVIGPYLLY